LSGTDIHSGSLSSTNTKYYYSINQQSSTGSNSETQLTVTFAHAGGSGSDTYGDSNLATTLKGETQAIYWQLSELLQIDTEASGGFKIATKGNNHGSIGLGTGSKDEYIYALFAQRDRFKDRVNKKTWTLSLSGSLSNGLTGSVLHLTDDSKTVPAVATPGGPRYNIVEGSLGVPTTAYTTKTYGWFYPEMGAFVFSGAQLSASIPGGPHFRGHSYEGTYNTSSFNGIGGSITASAGGTHISGNVNPGVGMTDFTQSFGGVEGGGTGYTIEIWSGSRGGPNSQRLELTGMATSPLQVLTSSVAITVTGSGTGNKFGFSASIGIPTTEITASWIDGSTNSYSASGFAPNLDSHNNANNAIRFMNCMSNMGTSTTLRLRSEEDATEENYFCRIRANEFNFSSNHTFVSGSKNKIRDKGMHGNPTVFITGIGLWNSAGQLLAISKLSKPLKKNFASEATLKVRLTY